MRAAGAVMAAMAKVQLAISDRDADRFLRQARREGLTLGDWLLSAAYAHLAARRLRFTSAEEVWELFERCDDAPGGSVREPDWEVHLEALDASRGAGAGPR